jgi:hypothetical protein
MRQEFTRKGPKPENSKLIFHPSFKETINDLKKLKIRLPCPGLPLEMDFKPFESLQGEGRVVKLEEEWKHPLDPYKGEKVCNELPICAYDESVNKFEGLEGTAFLTSHSLIVHGETDFVPVSLLTFYFYTRAEFLSESSDNIKFSQDHEVDSKKDYIVDREFLLTENVPEDSVVFIDGPVIGAQMSSHTIRLSNSLLEKNAIPIFFVKNSNSNLVTNYIKELKGKFNSDLHWAYKYLSKGERTCFFEYVDPESRVAKVFCYLKAFDVSPSRIEMDVQAFKKYFGSINSLFDLIYYLLLAQGDLRNPQIRSIAIAEKFSRATISLVNLSQVMIDLGITPTMNQERFAW